MSTILKALKKLESETDGSATNSSGIPLNRNRTASDSKRKRNRILWTMGFVLLLAGITGSILWIPILEPMKAERKDRNFRKVQTTSEKPSLKSKKIAASKIDRFAQHKPIPPSLPRTESRKLPSPGSAPKIKNKMNKQRSAIPKPSVTKTRTQRRSAPRQPKSTFNPMKQADSRFTLQAIAWSENPKERLAVINGLVLREGDGFEGMTVKQIDAKGVIVRQGSKRFNLKFQAR